MMNQDPASLSSATTYRPQPPAWMISQSVQAASERGSMQDNESELRTIHLLLDFSHLGVRGIDTLPTPLHNKR